LPRESRALKELWSIGNDEDDPVLGMITRVLGDGAGQIYLLDTRQHLVHVFKVDGEYAGTVGREGDGPGEVREPRDLLLMPDGTLGLLKRMPGGIVQVELDGTPAGSRVVDSEAEGGFTSLQQAKRGKSTIVVLGRHSLPVDGGVEWEYFLAPVQADNRLGPSFTRATARLGGGLPEFREADHYVRMFMPWCVGPNDFVYFAPDRERYSIRVCTADGAVVHDIEREFETAVRSEAVFGDLRAAFESCIRGRGAQVEFEIEKTSPAVVDLQVDSDGALWVRHSHSLVPAERSVELVYDVFGADGRLIKQVALKGAEISDKDGLYLLPGNLAVLVRDHLFSRVVIDCQGSGSTVEAAGEDVMLPLVTCFEVEW
jgi:hypothetical protein